MRSKQIVILSRNMENNICGKLCVLALFSKNQNPALMLDQLLFTQGTIWSKVFFSLSGITTLE